MDYSNHNALFQPLVGTEPHTVLIPAISSSSSDDEPSAYQEQPPSPQEPTSLSSSPPSPPHNHDMWITVLLFTLMYLHFGLIYYSDPNHIINGVSWTTINISISLFIIATFLYRQALHDCRIQHDCLVLLPEILVLISMGLVFCQNIMAAFLLLAIGKL